VVARASQWLLPPFTLVALAVIWQIVTQADHAPLRIVPTPDEVWNALRHDWSSLLTRHLPTTLQETLIGLAIALIVGIALAAALDFSPILRRAVYPLLILSQTIPLIALAPVLILIFGFGIEPKITVVVLYCIFPITLDTLHGLDSSDAAGLLLMRSFGANRWQTWRKVRLPAALPSLFAGLRIAAAYSATGAIIGEYITSNQGLGYYMRFAYAQSHVDQAFVAIVITALLSIGLTGGVALVERLLLGWYYAQLNATAWNEPQIE